MTYGPRQPGPAATIIILFFKRLKQRCGPDTDLPE
jgi:hypothetical protein